MDSLTSLWYTCTSVGSVFSVHIPSVALYSPIENCRIISYSKSFLEDSGIHSDKILSAISLLLDVFLVNDI